MVPGKSSLGIPNNSSSQKQILQKNFSHLLCSFPEELLCQYTNRVTQWLEVTVAQKTEDRDSVDRCSGLSLDSVGLGDSTSRQQYKFGLK